MKPNDSAPAPAIEAQAELITIGSSVSPSAETAGTVLARSQGPAPSRRKGVVRTKGDRTGCVHWPRAVLDACRLAFIAGATLAALSVQHGIPYDTLQGISKRERWPEQAAELRLQRSGQLTEEQAKWLAEQREKQIKRGVNVGSKLQDAIVRQIDDAPDALALMQLATAAEKATGVVRRELGMDGEKGGSANSSQFAIHASTVNLSL